MSGLPPIKWAQRSDSLYITIDVADVKDQVIELSGSTLKFHGRSGTRTYECNLELFAEVDASDEATKYSVRPRDVHFHIMKKDRDAEFWPRLLKDKALEKTNVKLDWDRYVDEDGEDAAGFDTDAMGPGAMNFGGGGGMPGGMGGMGGMDFASMMGGMGGGMPGGMGGMGGMDLASMMKGMGGMGGAPGMGGMGGYDDEEDDEGDYAAAAGGPGAPAGDSDDDLPDLEADESDAAKPIDA